MGPQNRQKFSKYDIRSLKTFKEPGPHSAIVPRPSFNIKGDKLQLCNLKKTPDVAYIYCKESSLKKERKSLSEEKAQSDTLNPQAAAGRLSKELEKRDIDKFIYKVRH